MQEIESFKRQINGYLKAFLGRKVIEAKEITESSYNLAKVLEEYTLRGGKRIRACLAIFGFLCFKEFDPEIVKAAISMELIQSYLLIHDDIMDKDDTRRGGKTVHKIYEGMENDRHFGESMAILAGNLANAFVAESIIDTNFDTAAKLKAIEKISKMFVKEDYGQVEDIIMEKAGGDSRRILNMYKFKTVPYTAEIPLFVGALLAGANENDCKIFELWAEKAGIAFQIQDDILGIFGNEAETGKPNDSDIKEGKNTFLIHKAMEMCSADEKEFLIKCLGNKNASEEDIEKVRTIVKHSGALDFCSSYSKKLVQEAQLILADKKFREEGKKYLNYMADFIINRAN